MSVSRFPNATEERIDKLDDLLDTLLGPMRHDPKVESTIQLIWYAHACAVFEMVLSSREIQALTTFDPVALQQMKDIIKECT